jgi:hypothetical protein
MAISGSMSLVSVAILGKVCLRIALLLETDQFIVVKI